jgi:signal transduction histidine kinase
MSVEADVLHVCVRDLVALSTMPAWWVGRSVVAIAESLQDTLAGMLSADCMTVELDERFTSSDARLARATRCSDGSARRIATQLPLEDRGARHIERATLREATLSIGVDGELGRVMVGAARENFPEELELLVMQVAVNEAAIALEHADLLHRHERVERQLTARAAQQAVVARLGLRALRATALDPLLAEAVAEARWAIAADHGDITELTDGARMLQLRAVDGWPGEYLNITYDVDYNTVAGRTALTSNPVVVADLHADPRFADHLLTHQLHVAGSVSVAILCPHGVFGVLGAHSDRSREFTDDDVHFLQAVANLLAAAIERLQTEGEREALLARSAAAQAEAERTSSAKTQFLGMMSHELRTPLNAIGGYAQLMEDEIGGPITAEQRAHLESITRSQRHLLKVIDDVLGFLKLGSGRMLYDIQVIAVKDILRASEELTRPMMTAKHLQYSQGDAPDDLHLYADGPKLRQILVNLLSNATKFTSPGGSVSVACSAEPATVSLRVSDTGSGIPPERLEAVFVPFMQLENARRTVEGTGLGLAISRDFAVGMGGQLLAESELGKGSTFTIVMPRAA